MSRENDKRFAQVAGDKGLLDETQVDELLAAEHAQAAEKGKLVLRSDSSFAAPPLRRTEAPLRRVVPATLAAKAVARGMMTESQAREVQRELLPAEAPRTLGRYEVVEELGAGGMGSVYKAWDSRLKIYVAAKTLVPALAANRAYIQRFEREAQLGAQLRTPHAVRVFDVGEEGPVHYIVMDYVEGESLADLFHREGKLDEKRACAICADAARALEEASSHDIIHRDIKPANIMLDNRGRVKVADLGIAKQLVAEDDDPASKQLSLTVGVIGTPTYMSPEQAMGRELDFRTDIYSLGATLYHLVCGDMPYKGGTPQEIMFKVAHDPCPDPRRLNPELSQPVAGVICKMMAKAPGLRYQTHAELIADLESCAQGRRPKASYARTVTYLAGPPPTEDAQRAAVVHRWRMVWFAATAVLLLAVIAGGVIWSLNREPATPSQSLPEGLPAQPAGRRSNLPAPAGQVTPDEAAKILLRQAEEIAGRNNYADAVTKLDDIIYRYPDSAARPQADTLKKQYQASIRAPKELEREIERAFRNAKVQEEAGPVHEAISTLGRLLPRAPDNQKLRNEIARLRKKLRAQETAAERKRNYKKFFDTGFICEAQGNWEGALKAYERAQNYIDTPEVRVKIVHVRHKLYMSKAHAETDLAKRIGHLTRALACKDDAATRKLLAHARKEKAASPPQTGHP